LHGKSYKEISQTGGGIRASIQDVRNASLEEYEKLGKETLYRAVREGNMNFGSIMAGQSAGLVKKEQTCKEMIEEIFMEAEKLIIKKSQLA